MSFVYKTNSQPEEIYFERGNFDRNLSLLLGLLACIFMALAVAVGYNTIGIMQSLFGFAMFGLAVIIFREYQLIPSFMIFDNKEKKLKLGNRKKHTQIPYSSIRKIAIGHEEHHERDSTNYYVYACLGQGGRWHLQSFGDHQEQAEAFRNELQAKLQLDPLQQTDAPIHPPAINHTYKVDGSVLFKWHDKEHIRYATLLLLFAPLAFLANDLLRELAPTHRLAISLFLVFVTTVAFVKIGLGLLTWHFVQLNSTELEYGILFAGKKRKFKPIVYSTIQNFLLNYIPTSGSPALRHKFCIITREFSFLHEDPNLKTLRKALETSEGDGFDLINVESLRLIDRIDLYFFIKNHIEKQINQSYSIN